MISKRRETFSDKRLRKIEKERFIEIIEYSWEENWKEYNYSNEEKTFLMLKYLERVLELREDIIPDVFQKLLELNEEDAVREKLVSFLNTKYIKK